VGSLMATVFGTPVARENGHAWEPIATAVVQCVTAALSAIFILLMVGALIGVMAFSAISEYARVSRRLIDPLLVRVRSAGALITSVMGTAIGLNTFAGDQYVASILPARMFLAEFKRRLLHPENLATAFDKLGHGHLAARPVEFLQRLHDGCARSLHVPVLPALSTQPPQSYPGRHLRLHRPRVGADIARLGRRGVGQGQGRAAGPAGEVESVAAQVSTQCSTLKENHPCPSLQ